HRPNDLGADLRQGTATMAEPVVEFVRAETLKSLPNLFFKNLWTQRRFFRRRNSAPEPPERTHFRHQRVTRQMSANGLDIDRTAHGRNFQAERGTQDAGIAEGSVGRLERLAERGELVRRQAVAITQQVKQMQDVHEMDRKAAGREALQEQGNLGTERKDGAVRVLHGFPGPRPAQVANDVRPPQVFDRHAQGIGHALHYEPSLKASRMPARVKG